MIGADESGPSLAEQRTQVWLLVAVTLALGWVLRPFYGTLLWSTIIAVLFAPAYRRLCRWLGHRRTPAALLTLLWAVVIVVVPFSLLTATLAAEASGMVQRLQSGEWNPAMYLRGVFDALPPWMRSGLARVGYADFEQVQLRLGQGLVDVGRFITTQALGIGVTTFDFVASLLITLYLAFFLIRDGEGLARRIRRAIPLAPRHKQAMFTQFTTVIRATVKGSLLVALIQGALGGLAFWGLGVGGALLWAVLMAFLSLLPAVGAALVWVPVAAWFLLNGAPWQGLALLIWGALVISLADNLLRPMLVGRDTRMPDALVMISTLGGLAVFGPNGIVIGPAIAAMFVAAWQIHEAPQDPAEPTAAR